MKSEPFHRLRYQATCKNDETTSLCVLSSQQFIVVWTAKTKQWLSTSDKITAIFKNLSETKREEVLDFARFLYQSIALR
jgi:hypothetical protein